MLNRMWVRLVACAKADYNNFLLMHAMGANAAGQIASAMAGGVLLALVPAI